MRRIELMTAGGVTLAGLGALVGLAIGSAGGHHTLAARIPPVEARTETIRRTVNVYRHEHPHQVAGAGPRGSTSTAPALAATRTRASGAAASAPPTGSTPVISTRSSGARSPSPSRPATSGGRTVTTRTSGGRASGGGTGSARPLSTHLSGGRGEHGGERDDERSHSQARSSSAARRLPAHGDGDHDLPRRVRPDDGATNGRGRSRSPHERRGGAGRTRPELSVVEHANERRGRRGGHWRHAGQRTTASGGAPAIVTRASGGAGPAQAGDD